MHIVFGADTGWNPQRRDDGSIPFRDIVRRHRSHVALGILTLVAGVAISPTLAAWMSPTIAGLILAVPISAMSGQLGLGLRLKGAGLLVTPEVIARANSLTEQLGPLSGDDCLRVLHADAELRRRHDAFIPPASPRPKGQIDPARAVAEAKLNEADSIEDAVRWLAPKERMVVLHDRALLAMLARLPERPGEGAEAVRPSDGAAQAGR
jgi:membrane glycosyltransferase